MIGKITEGKVRFERFLTLFDYTNQEKTLRMLDFFNLFIRVLFSFSINYLPS